MLQAIPKDFQRLPNSGGGSTRHGMRQIVVRPHLAVWGRDGGAVNSQNAQPIELHMVHRRVLAALNLPSRHPTDFCRAERRLLVNDLPTSRAASQHCTLQNGWIIAGVRQVIGRIRSTTACKHECHQERGDLQRSVGRPPPLPENHHAATFAWLGDAFHPGAGRCRDQQTPNLAEVADRCALLLGSWRLRTICWP